jgi:two-component system, OmpR family, KDP operon response regulator KdpE
MTTSNSPRVVLIVDDEIQIRRFLRAGFELDGFVVLETATVAESITAATLQSPDLIVLDLGLPDADGAELVERVRTWSEVPIIVLSVQSDEPEKVRLLELGAEWLNFSRGLMRLCGAMCERPPENRLSKLVRLPSI